MGRQGLDSLSWDDIRLVGVIAETGSLPTAANRLGLHHSTIFRRLREIETRLGFPVFERAGSRLVPSTLGEDIVELASRVGMDVSATALKLMGREMQPSGEVRVATNDSLLIHLLTPIFARFQEACPNVTLDVVIANPAANLSRRDADVAIRATDAPPETLIGRRTASIAWALYGRKGEEPGAGVQGEIALMGRHWVALGESMGGMKVVRHAMETVPPDRLRYRVHTVLALAAAVEAGIGIGHLPCFIGDTSPALVRLAPPEPSFQTDLWLLTHEDLRRTARIRVLLDFVAEALGREHDLLNGTATS